MVPNPIIMNVKNGQERTFITVYDASVSLNIDGTSSASIKLGEGKTITDEGWSITGRIYIKMFTQQGSVGIFRTRSPRIGVGSQRTTVELEHAINALGDYVYAAKSEKQMGLKKALTEIMGFYKGGLWKLGSVDGETDNVIIDSSYETCLEAIEGIMEQIPNRYFTFDFTQFPWVLNVKNRPTSVTAEGRLSRNVKSAVITKDDSELCTKVFIDGAGGTGTFGSVQDDDAIAKYGIIEKTISGANSTKEIAIATAKSHLNRYKKPLYSITIDAIDLSQITGEPLDKFTIGKKMRLALPDFGITVEENITQINWGSVYRNPSSMSITLADEEESVVKYLKKQQKSASKSASKAQATTDKVNGDKHICTGEIKQLDGDDTLYLYNSKGKEILHFKKAARFTVDWSGESNGKFTVKTDPKGFKERVYTLSSKPAENSDETPYDPNKNGNNWYVPIYVNYKLDDNSPVSRTTGFRVYVSAQTNWNNGWDDAKGKVVMPPSVSYGVEHKNIVVKVPGISSNQRAQISKTFALSKDTPPESGETATGFAMVKIGNDLVGSISIGNWYNKGYAVGYAAASGSGYDDGWDAAYGRVSIPAENKATRFSSFSTPPSAVNGNAIVRNLSIEEFDANTVDIKLSFIETPFSVERIIARKEHGQYNKGWGAARGKVQAPSENTISNGMSVWVPSATIGKSEEFAFLLDNALLKDGKTIDQNRVRLIKVSNGKTVAQFPHNQYTYGWNAAVKKIKEPKENTISNGMSVWVPASDVGKDRELAFLLDNALLSDGRTVDKNRVRLIRVSDGKTVAQFPHSQYTYGWSAAVAKVVEPPENKISNGMSVWVPASQTGTDRELAFILDNARLSDGTTVDKNRVRLIRVSDGKTVAQFPHNQYSYGWVGAVLKVKKPKENTISNGMSVWVPSGTIGAVEEIAFIIDNARLGNGQTDPNRVRLISVSDGITVAQFPHNQNIYGQTEGWRAAYSNVFLPITAKYNSESITIRAPSSDVGSQTARTYTMTENGKNTVDLVTEVSGNDVVVARLVHGRYAEGWKNAVDQVHLPVSASTGNTITVQYPANAPDGNYRTRTYTLRNEDDNTVKLTATVSGEQVTVAKLEHGKHTKGRNDTTIKALTDSDWTTAPDTDIPVTTENTATFSTDAPTPKKRSLKLIIGNTNWNGVNTKVYVFENTRAEPYRILRLDLQAPFSSRPFARPYSGNSHYYGKLYDANGNALTDNSYYWYGNTLDIGESAYHISTLYIHT